MTRKKTKARSIWRNKDRIIKAGDNVMVGGRPTDIVIPVMGPTGVGKSTFINHLLGGNVMPVGHDLSSCTSKLQYAIVEPPPCRGHRVIIVDTPGFDDTYEDDVEILRRIAAWLASSYDANMKLGGVIYLLSIADKRMKGTTLRNLEMFSQLCGDKALARVVLGTTNWGEVKDDVGKKREQQLDKTFWSTMTGPGSKSMRFLRTSASARVFLDTILNQLEFGADDDITNDSVLRIQDELVELERRIPETAAGKKLRYSLEQLREMQKDEAVDSEKAAALSASIDRQIAELQIPFSRKVALFFKFGKK